MNKKITAHQAAAILGYSVEHVHRLLRLGAMNGEKFNRVWIIDYKEVERIKREQTDGGRFYHGKTTGPRQ